MTKFRPSLSPDEPWVTKAATLTVTASHHNQGSLQNRYFLGPVYRWAQGWKVKTHSGTLCVLVHTQSILRFIVWAIDYARRCLINVQESHKRQHHE
jgi:hypothetical protein